MGAMDRVGQPAAHFIERLIAERIFILGRLDVGSLFDFLFRLGRRGFLRLVLHDRLPAESTARSSGPGKNKVATSILLRAPYTATSGTAKANGGTRSSRADLFSSHENPPSSTP